VRERFPISAETALERNLAGQLNHAKPSRQAPPTPRRLKSRDREGAVAHIAETALERNLAGQLNNANRAIEAQAIAIRSAGRTHGRRNHPVSRIAVAVIRIGKIGMIQQVIPVIPRLNLIRSVIGKTRYRFMSRPK